MRNQENNAARVVGGVSGRKERREDALVEVPE